VDDGVSSRQEAVDLLKEYQDHGFSHIVCTPHFNDPYVRTRVLRIREEYTWLEQTAAEYGITIHLGSEHYIGPNEGKFIPFLGKFLLVETDTDHEPLFLLDRIFSYRIQGYTVIFAHVERYSWFSLSSATAVRLREMGVLYQVNANSLKSKGVQKLLEEGWVDFIASDNHGRGREKIDFHRWKQYPDMNQRALGLLGLET
jgi:protein-tyrosine phosphatase